METTLLSIGINVVVGAVVYLLLKRRGTSMDPHEAIGLPPQELGRVGNAAALGIAHVVFAGMRLWKRLRRC